MKITYYGHSCFSAELGGLVVLFDPFLSGNPLAKAIDPTKLPADLILVSHAHADHLADAPAIARRTGALVASNYEIVNWFNAQGVSNTHPLNHGGGFTHQNLRIKFVNAIHSSSLPDGSYGGQPGGFVIQAPEGNLYYSGDTALTLDMQLVGQGPRLHLAAFPIGDNFTMGFEDAIRAAEFVQCDSILGLHYDTFPPIQIDREAARNAFAAAKKTLHLPAIGETVNL